jgi:molybdopterin converting factor small subunit
VARVVVLLPALLATEAGGRSRFVLEVGTVGQALRALPVSDLLFDETGELRRLVNVYVDGVDAREQGGIALALADGATLRIVQAVAGGAT